MPSTAIVIDSTVDLPPGVQQRFGIESVPLVVTWDGITYRDKLDLTTAEFYQRLRTAKTLPKTGSPSPALFEELYRRLLQSHEAVIGVFIAAKLSATFDTATSAARAVDPDRIFTVDSGSVSVASGWLAHMAAELGEQGHEPRAIVSTLQEAASRLRIFAVLDTLEFLQKGGRIGRANALAGSLLNIKPIISIQEGEVLPIERVRTRMAAVRRLVDVAASAGPVERVAAMHGDAAADVEPFSRVLAERFPGRDIELGEIGSVVGTYAGPGMLGIALLLAKSPEAR